MYELDGGNYAVITMRQAFEDLFDADEYIQWLIETNQVPCLEEV